MELFTAAINGAAAWLNPSSVQTQEAPQDVEPEADQEGFDISELGTIFFLIYSLLLTRYYKACFWILCSMK